MPAIVQLSDLHLLANPGEQEAIFDDLVATLGNIARTASEPVALLVVTGDVFDSATLDASMATHRFKMLHKEICRALGPVPTVIVPGNHDRRKNGLFAPHRLELFDSLRDAMGPQVFVHGCNTPFLSQLVPQEFHGLPLWLVAYDSTYLPRGLISAGGALRQEDLLQTAAQIGDEHPDWPVIVLIHHHLVPTPLTDLGAVELGENSNPLVRWGVQRMLPGLVANADREELTMTALGAGTALSTLHTLGRAVLVLHGHKHYATARLLDALIEGQGDVLVVSAGSAGVAQSWSHDARRDTARLWPSFNLIEWSSEFVSIDTVSFAWKERQSARHARRALVRARRSGSQWQVQHIKDIDLGDAGPRLLLNRSRHSLVTSRSFVERWDYTCERVVSCGDERTIARYVETVEGPRDARFLLDGQASAVALPAHVHLELDGAVEYRVEGGLVKNLDAARRLFGDDPSPFASVGLMNRYFASTARLELGGLLDVSGGAFASATDLGTGLERPIRLERLSEPGSAVAEVKDCPPRTLLRIYWRLARS